MMDAIKLSSKQLSVLLDAKRFGLIKIANAPEAQQLIDMGLLKADENQKARLSDKGAKWIMAND